MTQTAPQKTTSIPNQPDGGDATETPTALHSFDVAGERERLAIAAERERIGMDLHDGIIQSIYAIGMHVDQLRATCEGQHAEELGRVIADLDRVVEDIRKYIRNLETIGSDPSTLNECLKATLQRVNSSETLVVDIEIPDVPLLFSASIVESICQIIQEALSNVVRHAQATHVRIAGVMAGGDLLQITVLDDGFGFDLGKARHNGGLALANMQKRARLYGGNVEIESQAGQGTRLTISIPLMPA